MHNSEKYTVRYYAYGIFDLGNGVGFFPFALAPSDGGGGSDGLLLDVGTGVLDFCSAPVPDTTVV